LSNSFSFSGSLQLVSSFTRNHKSLTFFENSIKSFCKVGSHQQITTQSNIQILVFRKFKKISSGIKSFINLIFSGKTNSELWQNWHLKLHQAVKIKVATFHG
jgi:hypothetical protein